MDWSSKVVLITGGTGSFGKRFTEIFLKKYKPKKLIIFSRDEFKQSEMAKLYPDSEYPIRYFLGDIRDKDRLCRAFEGVDYVVHAAALKQVPALEYNPTEAVKTNVVGADNIVDAAIDKGVRKVIALSTDKAVIPINVVGSRGSVVPFFLNLKKQKVKEFPITDERMTRFWITLEQGVELVIRSLHEAEGGEVFVPVIPSMKVVDLAKAIEPKCTFRIIGVRPGEKVNETLISEDEARNTKIYNGIYVILPPTVPTENAYKKYEMYPFVTEGFTYRSDKNDKWLSISELREILSGVEIE
jgi:UDP-N-acetylglucosamine 4,6-dehydratase